MRVELRQVEDVAHEPLEPFRLEADHLERMRPRRLVLHDALEQRVHVAADGRQRRPQLVRDGHQEVPLQGLGLFELRSHVPEPRRQMADLAAARHLGNSDAVAAGGNLVGRLGQREHRLRDPSREVPAERAGDENSREEGGQEPPDERQHGLVQAGLRSGEDDRSEQLAAELDRAGHRQHPG